MAKALFMEERRRSIVEKLQEVGRVSVNELSEWLSVSAVTIRQDLRALEEENLLERTHGGAMLPRGSALSAELSFEVRNRVNHNVKDAIARRAAAIVQSGQSIALDASTTCYRMLPYLKQLDRLIIVTNSLMIAQSCLDSPQIDVFMPGGRLRRDSISLVGKPDELPSVNLNYGFFGAHGISKSAGITESSRAEVEIKQALMEHCLEVYFVLDATKWGRVAPYTIESPHHYNTIITSQNIPEVELNYFSKVIGLTIVQVED